MMLSSRIEKQTNLSFGSCFTNEQKTEIMRSLVRPLLYRDCDEPGQKRNAVFSGRMFLLITHKLHCDNLLPLHLYFTFHLMAITCVIANFVF